MDRMLVFALTIIMVLFCSCSSVKDVPQPMRDTVIVDRYVDRVKVDSVYVDQWHYVYKYGDTVFKTDSIFFYKYYYSRDTISIHDTSVVNVPYKVTEKEIEKVYLWWPGVLVVTLASGAFLYFKKRAIKMQS